MERSDIRQPRTRRALAGVSSLEQWLRAAAARLAQSETPRLDARVIAKHALDLSDAALIADGDRRLTAEEVTRLDALIRRRVAGEPVAHIVGRREFWSLDIEVPPGILVPRADSETLIEAIVRRRRPDEALAILDLGCGSGALLCALLVSFTNATGLGVDIDPLAVATTTRNLERLGLAHRASARAGDWFEGLGERFDLIVANPPYIRTIDRGALPREVRDFEDPRALFAGPDGQDAYRAILTAAPSHLAANGLLVLELGEGQAGPVKALARKLAPPAQIRVENDLGGRPRAMVIDQRRGTD